MRDNAESLESFETQVVPKPNRNHRITPEVFQVILRSIEAGKTLKNICRELATGENADLPLMSFTLTPAEICIYVNDTAGARKAYASARQFGHDAMAEEILDIADDGRNDYYEKLKRNGELVVLCDHENVNRSRLRVDSRKWLLSKLNPEKYGERSSLEVSGGLDIAAVLSTRLKRIEATEGDE